MGHFLQEKAGYFIYCYYRCNSGYFLLSTKNLVRNPLRGAVFYFLHELYLEELLLLSVAEALVLVILIVWESTAEAFVSKVFYCLELIYHFLFILLNLSLYFGSAAESTYFAEELKELAFRVSRDYYILTHFTHLFCCSCLIFHRWLG